MALQLSQHLVTRQAFYLARASLFCYSHRPNLHQRQRLCVGVLLSLANIDCRQGAFAFSLRESISSPGLPATPGEWDTNPARAASTDWKWDYQC